MHSRCRGTYYPRTDVTRFAVPDDKVSWSIAWPEYEPTCYNSKSLNGQVWADPDLSDPTFHPKWNSVDGNINRTSHMGEYSLSKFLPLNPIGRTGICGRGCLGRWGPNHAADPIVSRWKRDAGSKILLNDSGKKILQFVAIQRRDSGEWAIPGGMVDPGEVVTSTLKREFLEEALNSLEKDQQETVSLQDLINKFFENGEVIYKGYVDDPRNTDNAWMETVAMNFHDEDGSSVGLLNLSAGDDAVNVKWVDVDKTLALYANHIDFIALVAKKHCAHW